MRVGFIGLGTMGGKMAASLQRAGISLVVHDARREAVQPYKTQRYADKFGQSVPYGWSEDKARQYSVPERADFGAFVRRKGFKLD